MRLNFRFISITLIACMTLGISCQKELPNYAKFADYSYATLDADAGTWTPILLSGPEEIAIPAPDDVTSDNYLGELAELKSLSANLDGAQREAVEYWSNNPVIRWNEIALS